MAQQVRQRRSRAADGETVRLTAAQALIRYLAVQYSERDGEIRRLIPAIFGIFGHGNVLGVGQAIAQEGAELPLYQPKNEQEMVHVAAGYAKASRRLQSLACTASIGPGSTNMLSGAATATINRLPVLLLPSDTFANRRQGPVLQQLEHPIEADATVNDLFRAVSVFFDRIARPEQLLTALPQAMRALLDQAVTGAVTISLHQDVQGEAFDFPAVFFEPRAWPVTRRPPAAAEIERAAALLASAERPLLIAGGGVRHSEAEAELARFAAHHSVPVAETSAGKGSLTESPWLLGGIGVNGTAAANRIAAEADLVVCVGTRLSDFTTGSHSLFQDPDVRFLGINTNAADAAKLSADAIVADAREALDALVSDIGPRSGADWVPEMVSSAIAVWERDREEDIARPGERIGQGEVLRTLNETARAGDWVVAAAGWQPGDLLKLWRVPAGGFTHIEFGASCMGHEIPAGVGIRMRTGPDGEVFVVIGDGTYLMNPSALLTAIQEQLKLTVLILDNGGYRSIARLADGGTGESHGNDFARRTADGRFPDGEPLRIDLVANAASLGARAVRAEDAATLRSALAEARKGEATMVIVCPTDPTRSLLASGAFWDLGVPEVSGVPETQRRSAEHLDEARRRQRHY